MNYATGHAFNLSEMFDNFNIKKLKANYKLSKEICNSLSKKDLASKVFKESVKIILEDIIDNNVTFQLPTGGRKSDIHVKRTSGEDFKKARRKGKWKEVDFLASFFSGYELTLNMYNKDGGVTRSKPIYVDKNLKNKLTEYTNNGKQYC